MMQSTQRSLKLCARIIMLFVSVLAIAQAQVQVQSLPLNLAIAVETFAPGASLLKLTDMDTVACNPIGDSPNLLRGDFSGNAREDVALLLKIKETGKVVEWQGVRLREAKLALVFFISDGKGGFKAKVAYRYNNYLPTASMITLVPAGNIQNRALKTGVIIRKPAAQLSFCEKSATLYYISAGRIRTIPLSD